MRFKVIQLVCGAGFSSSFTARYNSLTLSIKGDYAIEARAYDDGVAYRFVTDFKKPFAVKDETVVPVPDAQTVVERPVDGFDIA